MYSIFRGDRIKRHFSSTARVFIYSPEGRLWQTLLFMKDDREDRSQKLELRGTPIIEGQQFI